MYMRREREREREGGGTKRQRKRERKIERERIRVPVWGAARRGAWGGAPAKVPGGPSEGHRHRRRGARGGRGGIDWGWDYKDIEY